MWDGSVVHSKNRKPELPEGFAIDLCQNSFADFISIFHANAVPEDVLKKAALVYLRQSDLSAKQLNKVYQSISDIKSLDSIKPNLLLRFAEQLHAEPPSEFVFGLYQDMAKEITKKDSIPTNCIDRIRTLYGDQMAHLELVLDTNRFARAEIAMQGLDRPLLTTVSLQQGDLTDDREFPPLYFLVWRAQLEDGQYKTYTATPKGSGSSTGTGDTGRYYTTIHAFMSGERTGSSWGAAGSRFSIKAWTRPGDLTIAHGINPETGEFTLEVALNENEPDAEAQ